jgi:formate dehydrogenase subunit gamma
MVTELSRHRSAVTGGTVERNRRASRWLHASVYSLSLLLLATGLWLLLGQEGNPSLLARASGQSDAVLHRWLGYALAVVAVLAIVVWWRGLRRFAKESVRWDRGDSAWLKAWPLAAFTGRFRRHEGDFDPGQRLANLVLVGTLVLLVLSGLVLTTLHGGPAFVVAHRVHQWSTYAFTIMVAGHVVVASGVLPGYRGAWRAMHLGGRLRRDVASRLWPAWVERNADDGDDLAARRVRRTGSGRRP